MERTTAIAIFVAVALAMATTAVASPEATTDTSNDVVEPDRHADTVVDTASRLCHFLNKPSLYLNQIGAGITLVDQIGRRFPLHLRQRLSQLDHPILYFTLVNHQNHQNSIFR